MRIQASAVRLWISPFLLVVLTVHVEGMSHPNIGQVVSVSKEAVPDKPNWVRTVPPFTSKRKQMSTILVKIKKKRKVTDIQTGSSVKLPRLVSTMRMCGTRSYNLSLSICCNATVVHLDLNTTSLNCCGQFLYSSTDQVCCGQRVWQKKGENNRHGVCCGTVLFDKRCYECKGDMPFSKFNETTEMCCEGLIKPRSLEKNCSDVSVFATSWNSKVPANGTEQFVDVRSRKSLPMTNTILVIGGVGVGVFVSVFWALVIKRLVWRKTSKRALSKRNMRDGIGSVSKEETEIIINADHDDLCQQSPEQILTKINGDGVQKDTPVPQENLLENVSVDKASQTLGPKPNNKRTVFGQPFEYSEILTKDKRTFEIPDSNVRMILPESLLAEHVSVEVLGSAPPSIPSIRRKFQCRPDEWLASPTVEYHVTGSPVFLHHAVIEMPFSGKLEDLRVWRFQSDEGASKVCKPDPVPRANGYTEELNCFFTYTPGEKVIRIYTRGFSIYFCSQCGKRRDLRLRADLYGSYKRLNMTCGRVSLSMPVIDVEYENFPQYKKKSQTKEEEQGRRFILDRLINLPGSERQLQETDCLRFSVESSPREEHIKTRDGLVCHPEVQKKDLKEVVQCHNRNDSGFVKDWLFQVQEKPCLPKEVEVIVKIECVDKDGNTLTEHTALQVTIKAEDTLTVPEPRPVSDVHAPENEQLRKYIIEEFSESEKTRMLTALGAVTSHSEYPSLEQLLYKLERENSPENFQRIVSSALIDSDQMILLRNLTSKHLIQEASLPTGLAGDLFPIAQADCPGACNDPTCRHCHLAFPESSTVTNVHAELYTEPVTSFDQRHPNEEPVKLREPTAEQPLLHPEHSRTLETDV